MNSNRKFKLVPIDTETRNIMSLEERMDTVRTSNTLDNNEKAAMYEDLMARLKNYKESINYTPPTEAIATSEYKAPQHRYESPDAFENTRHDAANSTGVDALTDMDDLEMSDENASNSGKDTEKSSLKRSVGMQAVDRPPNVSVGEGTTGSKKQKGSGTTRLYVKLWRL